MSVNLSAMGKTIDTTKSKITDFQQSLLDSVAPIKAMANQLNYLLLGMKGVQKATVTTSQTVKKATEATYKYSAAQKALNIQTTDDGKTFTKAGFKVDEYGRALNNAGERVNNFNKRTALMQATVKGMNKAGEANVGFLKGWSKYTELGGNSAEYFAEFLTSGREELTIFGLEAAKARKVLYGFAPPGTFRVLNKFSSILQFVGGTYRKMGDDGRFAKDKIKELQDAMKEAESEGDTEAIEAFKEQIKDLQDTLNPSIVGKFFGSMMKIGKIPRPKFLDSFKIIPETMEGLKGGSLKKMLGSAKTFITGTKGTQNAQASQQNRFGKVTGWQSQFATMTQGQGQAGTPNMFKRLGAKLKGINFKQFFKNAVTAKGIREGFDSFNTGIADLKSQEEKVATAQEEMAVLLKRKAEYEDLGIAEDDVRMEGVTKDIEDKGEELNEQKDIQQKMLEGLLAKHPIMMRAFKFMKLMTKIPKMINIIVRFILKAYYYFAFLILGLLVIVKAVGPMFSEIWSAVSAMFALGLELMAGSIGMIWEGLTDIWDAFFGDGDLDTAIGGLIKVGLGALSFVGSLLLTLAGAALVFIGGVVVAVLKRLGEFFAGGASIGKKVVIALAIVGFFVATFWFQMSLFPALLVGLLIYWIGKKIGQWLGFWATGGVVDKPLQMVGERGPELVSMARGSRVYSNRESKQMMASKSGGNTINITINARDTSDKELRRIATKIGDMVNRQVNRGTSSRTV
tara:strand:- start:1114 stop:3330 length:2217 start_codon:yes stop_codon:yes gene_type:complete